MPIARIDAEVVAIFIPILMVMGGVLIAITAIITSGRKKDLEHRERLIALEKGLPLPEPIQRPARRVHSSRRAGGLVMTGIGIALTVGVSGTDGFDDGWFGLIPLLIGVGLLIAAHLDKREFDQDREREEKARRVE
jgi:uncharacterized membrane protein